MAQSKKRRHSMSPSRSQQTNDGPEYKKRKSNGTASNVASSSKVAASRAPLSRSSPPHGSDSSTTLDGDTPPSKDKGKAVEKDPLVLELDRLRKEVAHKNELLVKTEKVLLGVTQTLTCQICLELMQKPYALAPCGHVSCHGCLVAWFTSIHSGQDEDDPDVEWISDNDSGGDASGNEQAPSGSVANGNPVEGNANANPAPPLNGDPAAPAPAPPTGAYPNSVHRRKTCPHCRCVVKERPVQIYALKDLVGIIDPQVGQGESAKKKSKIEGGKGAKEKDPWKGIFRLPKGSGHGHGHGRGGGDDSSDDQDDYHPGWPGFAVPNNYLAPDVDDEEEVAMGYHDFNAHHHYMHVPPPILPLLHVPGGWDADAAANADEPLDLPPPFVDNVDGVRRCGLCMYELWHGECTNGSCGAVYTASDDGSHAPHMPHYGGHHHGDDVEGEEDEEDGVAEWRFPADVGEDDGYESSFIDDDEACERRNESRQVREAATTSANEAEDPEDDFVPGPSRRWTSGTRETIVISSDEEDEPATSTRVRRGRTRQIIEEEDEDEEQEVEGDVGSVEEGNSHPDHFYGFEGESSHGSAVSEARSRELSVVSVHDEEDEDSNGYVPYVWDEDQDDEDGVVYDEDEDEEEY